MSKFDIDFYCNYSSGNYTVDEMKKGWKNGDIIWCGGFLSIMYRGEKNSQGYNVMTIGSIDKSNLQILRKLPNETSITFKTVNFFFENHTKIFRG
ncbi:MAG: hypothetical protein BHW55_00890 [Candidatus Melainabacteria bacterium 35_41]|nr:MAG: hypothetical protein BHW55_00890 [Candidatus Melainabacteria bacterium 35_41]